MKTGTAAVLGLALALMPFGTALTATTGADRKATGSVR